MGGGASRARDADAGIIDRLVLLGQQQKEPGETERYRGTSRKSFRNALTNRDEEGIKRITKGRECRAYTPSVC